MPYTISCRSSLFVNPESNSFRVHRPKNLGYLRTHLTVMNNANAVHQILLKNNIFRISNNSHRKIHHEVHLGSATPLRAIAVPVQMLDFSY